MLEEMDFPSQQMKEALFAWMKLVFKLFLDLLALGQILDSDVGLSVESVLLKQLSREWFIVN